MVSSSTSQLQIVALTEDHLTRGASLECKTPLYTVMEDSCILYTESEHVSRLFRSFWYTAQHKAGLEKAAMVLQHILWNFSCIPKVLPSLQNVFDCYCKISYGNRFNSMWPYLNTRGRVTNVTADTVLYFIIYILHSFYSNIFNFCTIVLCLRLTSLSWFSFYT